MAASQRTQRSGPAGLVAVAHASALAGSERFRAAHSPQLVVTVGSRTPAAASWPLINAADIHIHAEPQRTTDWPDPTRTAICVLGSVPAPPPTRRFRSPASGSTAG